MRMIVRIVRFMIFVPYFLWELTVSNALVAWEVITPRHYMQPGIIEYPMRSKRTREIVLLANFISLTPGTLSVDVSSDHTKLYVHGLHVSSPDDLRRRVGRLEDMLLGFLR